MSDIFHYSMSPAELLVRGTVMYVFLLLIFRFVLHRDSGSAGVPDILFVVLLGDAAQNGMIGNGTTVADSATLIAVLAAWNYALDALAYYSPTIARLTDPPALLLVKNGRLIYRNLRREHITPDEVESALRKEGLNGLDQVRKIYLEPNGGFSILKVNP
jgi:uncharacterized membrane protein YcaP (DUF421 family)